MNLNLFQFYNMVSSYSSMSCCRWVFKTESHDIAFGVTYIIDVSTNSVPPSPTDTGAPKELVRSLSGELKGEGNPRVAVKPIARVNCHQIPEDGYLECEQTGTCMYTLQYIFPLGFFSFDDFYSERRRVLQY